MHLISSSEVKYGDYISSEQQSYFLTSICHNFASKSDFLFSNGEIILNHQLDIIKKSK
jgi:hypothetical protein